MDSTCYLHFKFLGIDNTLIYKETQLHEDKSNENSKWVLEIIEMLFYYTDELNVQF